MRVITWQSGLVQVRSNKRAMARLAINFPEPLSDQNQC